MTFGGVMPEAAPTLAETSAGICHTRETCPRENGERVSKTGFRFPTSRE